MNFSTLLLRAITFLLGCHISIASAQQYLWHLGLGSTERPLRYTDIAVDQSGNVYTLGMSFEDIDLDPGPGTSLFSIANSANNHADIFIAKYDSTQELLWHISLAGITAPLTAKTPARIELDGDSALYFVATYRGSADFDPGPDTSLITWSNPGNLNSGDLVIARYGTDGTFRWVHSMGSRRGDFMRETRVGPDGTLVIGGKASDTLDLDPGPNEINLLPDPTGIYAASYVVSYDQEGNYLKHLAMPFGTLVTHIAVNSANEHYVYGAIYDTVDLDLGPQTYWLAHPDSVFQSGFIAKYSSEDSLLWANYLVGAIANHGPGGLAIDEGDNAYVLCIVNGVVDILPGSDTQIIGQENSGELILAKFDSLGQFDWVNYFPSSDPFEKYPENVVVSPGGDAFIAAGTHAEKVDVDPSADSLIITNSYYDRDFYQETFLAGYEPTGAVKWGFGLTLAEEGSKVEALFLRDSTLYWAGSFMPAAQFAAGVTDSSSGSTPFVVAYRVRVTPVDSSRTTSMDPASFRPLSLYPNPAKTAIHVSTEGLKGLLGMQVLDMYGRLVKHQFQYAKGEQILSIEDLASGIYFLRVQEVRGKDVHQGRFVKR
ncbi:MAG: T9SS type A sorting domain-containing protein [Bacteroidota bacterium]